MEDSEGNFVPLGCLSSGSDSQLVELYCNDESEVLITNKKIKKAKKNKTNKNTKKGKKTENTKKGQNSENTKKVKILKTHKKIQIWKTPIIKLKIL